MKLVDVTINGTSLMGLGFYLEDRIIGMPEPNIQMVEVPGRDGAIDITEFMGVSYKNREISITLAIKDYSVWETNRRVVEGFNGKRVDVAFSNEPGIYWSGRMVVSSYAPMSRRINEVQMVLTADPFPYDSITGEEVRGEDV